MRAIINGKRYDTDTADELCQLTCNAYMGDFRWHDTRLYRTRRGTFFLAGEGGPASMWARAAAGGGSREGSGIRVITDMMARD